jgi:tryptophanyl-tRNA synthetase
MNTQHPGNGAAADAGGLSEKYLEHALKEIRMDAGYIEEIMAAYQYRPSGTINNIRTISDSRYITAKYSCHDQAEVINEVPLEDAHIVTGFGPTNAPTGGTLSLILKAISLQLETGLPTTIIISNLGAFNSRNLDIREIEHYTDKFLQFIPSLGFDLNNGELRTHIDHDNLVVSGLIAKVFNIEDFEQNKEVTDAMYQAMGLRGNAFSTYVDMLFTVADILKPAFVNRKRRILVLAGLEEHYFPELAKICVGRLHERYGDLFIPSDIKIGALYAQLIRGMHPYPKMSKSIPDSSINLGDSYHDLKRKILDCGPENESVILQLINLVSDWTIQTLAEANAAFELRDEEPMRWMQVKRRYLEYFMTIKEKWDRIPDSTFQVSTSFFSPGQRTFMGEAAASHV